MLHWLYLPRISDGFVQQMEALSDEPTMDGQWVVGQRTEDPKEVVQRLSIDSNLRHLQINWNELETVYKHVMKWFLCWIVYELKRNYGAYILHFTEQNCVEFYIVLLCLPWWHSEMLRRLLSVLIINLIRFVRFHFGSRSFPCLQGVRSSCLCILQSLAIIRRCPASPEKLMVS